MKQDKQSFCVIISKREKDGAQPLISYVVYSRLILVSVKVLILFQGIFDATEIVIYHAVTIGSSEKKKTP